MCEICEKRTKLLRQYEIAQKQTTSHQELMAAAAMAQNSADVDKHREAAIEAFGRAMDARAMAEGLMAQHDGDPFGGLIDLLRPKR
jgi:hypothetical protein